MGNQLVRTDLKQTPADILVRVQQVVALYCDEHRLTPREKQVVMLVCAGAKNLLIARRLGVSEATIRLHITNIHRKLGTGTKVDMVLRAFAWWLAREPQVS